MSCIDVGICFVGQLVYIVIQMAAICLYAQGIYFSIAFTQGLLFALHQSAQLSE